MVVSTRGVNVSRCSRCNGNVGTDTRMESRHLIRKRATDTGVLSIDHVIISFPSEPARECNCIRERKVRIRFMSIGSTLWNSSSREFLRCRKSREPGPAGSGPAEAAAVVKSKLLAIKSANDQAASNAIHLAQMDDGRDSEDMRVCT